MSNEVTLPYTRLKPTELKKPVPALFIDAKLDGWLLDIVREGPGESGVRAVTRSSDIWYKLKHYKQFSKIALELPIGCAVQGELYVPSRPASDVPKALCSSIEALQFGAFSIPWWNGEDALHNEALRDMEPNLVEAQLRRLGCRVVPRYVLPVKQDITLSGAHELYVALRKQVADLTYKPNSGYAAVSPEDVEGIVLKASHFSGWFKYKASRTVDLVVIGLKEGQGKNMGMYGSLHGGVLRYDGYCPACLEWRGNIRGLCPKCNAHLDQVEHMVEVASVGGMDNETLEQLGDDDVGRVFECEYQYLGSGNKLRHPRFKRWRDDKPATECTWKQILDQR